MASHNESVQADALYTITDLETLRVISDPLRIQILERLEQPTTVKELARVLDTTPTKLYYHVNLLEKHELIRVVETKIVSGIVEKSYQLRALRFTVDESLLAPGSHQDGDIDSLLYSILETTRAEILASVAARNAQVDDSAPNEKRIILTRSVLSLTPEQALDLQNEFESILEKYGSDEEPSADKRQYGFTIALYPLAENKEDNHE
ncbi:MAG: helix-turn-helix domain-containing protein [Caldilineaceae bacterium]